MFAAAKQDVIEFVIFEGVHQTYELWFEDFLKDGFIMDDYGTGIYYSQNGEIALNFGDVFLCNRLGDIRHMTQEEFNDYFYVCE